MKRNKALAEQVARLVEAGNDSHIAARSLGIDEASLDEWLETWPWFQALMDRAYAKFEIGLTEKLAARDIVAEHRRAGRQRYFERLKALSLGQAA